MMENGFIPKNIQIVYFSGTGGAQRVADSFVLECTENHIPCSIFAIDHSKSQQKSNLPPLAFSADSLTLLIYAVHAFDAPSPVYDWIAAENISSIRFAVISVSGGGEVWPNTGCRSLVIKELEKKGATILVDDMIVMPSNMNPAVNDSTAMWLLKALPIKVKKIFSILLEGNSYRSTKTLDPFRAFATKQEKKSAYKFSKSIKLGMNCTGCGWCANNCPQDNIDIVFRHPEFKDKCVACFRCIYGCPRQAMWSKNAIVIKSGYSLSEIEKRIPGATLKPIDECCSGKLFKGVLKYLKEAFPNN